MKVKIDDHTEEVLAKLQEAKLRAMTACGALAEGYAKDLCPTGKVNGGNLKNSITYEAEPEVMRVGTNVKYAAYVEFGTGIYAETGGRRTPWVAPIYGEFRVIQGIEPQPFLRPSISKHLDEYKNIIDTELKEATY